VARPPSVLLAVDVRAVEAAQVAQARGRWVHLQDEVMARRGGVVGGELGMAIGRAAKEERVMAVELELASLNRPRHHLEADATRHGAAGL